MQPDAQTADESEPQAHPAAEAVIRTEETQAPALPQIGVEHTARGPTRTVFGGQGDPPGLCLDSDEPESR
eukprot:3083475-Rhodomonas_salina.1